MKKQTYILIILIINCLIFSSCSRFIINKYGWERPKKPNFRLAKLNFKLISNDIDTNTIYVSKEYISVNLDPLKYEKLYSFYRFWSNGRVFQSKAYKNHPTNFECNNLNEGLIGYYVIENGILEIEIFAMYGGGKYVREKFKFENDKLISLEKRAPGRNETSYVYYKENVGTLYSRPDW